MKKQPIGAYATIQWIEENSSEISGVYFSFGQFDEEKDTDTFGVDDGKIFYYAEDEHDMEALKQSVQDFKVLSYSLEYKHEV